MHSTEALMRCLHCVFVRVFMVQVKHPVENGDTHVEAVSEELKIEKESFYERYKKFQEEKGVRLFSKRNCRAVTWSLVVAML